MNISVEDKIHLNKFAPREYQLPVLDAIENKGYRRVLAIMPRRAGKDITAFNLCIRECLRKSCVIYYIFPTYAQAKKVIWDSLTNDGKRFLDFIPDALIKSKNSQEMKIRFVNGSLLQLVGSDNYDSLVGTNPQGVVFSEYALQDPRAYQFIRPILTANDGWALFISTPRGKNHLWELYQIALHSPDWFAYKLSVEDTGHIPLEEIERERREGVMSDDLIMQEYYCSFNLGVEGSYYGKYLDKIRLNGQVGVVPWENGFQVHTAWDLGVRDSTSIIFFQTIGQTIRIIDYYENTKEGMEHYVNILNSKPYTYGKHIAPHDIKVTEWGTGLTRLEKARQLGVKFTVAPDLSIVDGIEAVRTQINKMWIDETKCSQLLKAIENYRQEYDIKKKVYKSQPLHNWSSHACFTGDTLVLTRRGMNPIMNINSNDEIFTLEGWKKCTQSIITQRNAHLVDVFFQDGTRVRCTPEHMFLTENGWILAKNLLKGSKIQSSLIQALNILMDLYIDYGLKKDILPKGNPICREMYGKMLLEKYQKIVTYIIETIIPLIIISGISNVYLLENICDFLIRIVKDLVKMHEIKQLNGIDLKQDVYGIRDTLLDALHGLSGNVSLDHVIFALKNLTVLLEKTDISKNFVIQIVKPLIIEKVEEKTEVEDVWDIYVPIVHHFSLFNGAIVHNCDAMRYLCISLPKTRDGLSAQELESRYREAVYGYDTSNQAPFFRDDLPRY